MTRPLTCLTVIAAAGAGLYLYQEKHTAQLLDQEINRTIRATAQIRERTGTMRAEWALLNDPERLAALAAQHLSLQTVMPVQFAQVSDLGNRLPPVGMAAAAPPVIEDSATPPPRLPPVKLTAPVMSQSAPSTMLPPRPAVPMMVQAVPPPAPHPVRMAMARPAEPPAPAPRPVFAPVVAAFASQAPMAPIHPPSVQQAAAVLPPAPFVGSALGMARTPLAAPVPIAAMGNSPAR